MKAILLFIPVILFMFGQTLSANTSTTNINDYFYSNSNAYNPDGIWIFLGSNVGLIDLSEDSNLPNRDGHQVNFKVVGSMYKLSNSFIGDLGAGFQSNTASGFGTEFTTQSFFIDMNARWEFINRWSVGPAANVLIGNKNTFTDEKKTLASFIGATVHYRQPLTRDWLLKVGARVLTDLDVSSRQVTKWLLDFQIGFPPTTGASIISQEQTDSQNFNDDAVYTLDDDLNTMSDLENNTAFQDTMGDESNEGYLTANDLKNETDTTSYQTFKSTSGPLVNIKLDELKYNKGKVQPNINDAAYIENLAQVLTENQDLFDKVNIKGHAGDFRYNKNKKIGNTNKIISHSRAKNILKKLATNGLPSSKIFSMSFGEYTPDLLDSSKQKVELEFSGVKDEAKLRELINSVVR